MFNVNFYPYCITKVDDSMDLHLKNKNLTSKSWNSIPGFTDCFVGRLPSLCPSWVLWKNWKQNWKLSEFTQKMQSITKANVNSLSQTPQKRSLS